MRQNTIKRHLAALCGAMALVMVGTASAVEVDGLLKMGYDAGGDKVTTTDVVFTDGTTANVRANEGIYIGGGLGLRMPEQKLAAEFSLAWKRGMINATNGHVYWTRYPLEALAFYVPLNKFRIGGGLTYHFSPKLEASGAAAGYANNQNYDSALGFIVQGDFLPAKMFSVGLRFTFIDYKPEGGGGTAKGNGVGVAAGFHF